MSAACHYVPPFVIFPRKNMNSQLMRGARGSRRSSSVRMGTEQHYYGLVLCSMLINKVTLSWMVVVPVFTVFIFDAVGLDMSGWHSLTPLKDNEKREKLSYDVTRGHEPQRQRRRHERYICVVSVVSQTDAGRSHIAKPILYITIYRERGRERESTFLFFRFTNKILYMMQLKWINCIYYLKVI